MKLIWTYNYNAKVGQNVGAHTLERRIILINYYILSIQSAKKLGYYTIIYCDDTYAHLFEKLVDELHIIKSTIENEYLWDAYKVEALARRTDDGEYCLIDGDVILKSKLPIPTTDFMFDAYETKNWKSDYQMVVNQMTDLGISKLVPEWNGLKAPVTSCGILYIKNTEFKNLYIDRWMACKKLVMDNVNEIDNDYATMVISQYLLTILINHYSISFTKLADIVGGKCDYYKHHCGSLKYNKPIVQTKFIIDLDTKKQLF